MLGKGAPELVTFIYFLFISRTAILTQTNPMKGQKYGRRAPDDTYRVKVTNKTSTEDREIKDPRFHAMFLKCLHVKQSAAFY